MEIREEDKLLTSGEVALLFRVDIKTVSRWAREGRMRVVRLPSGHRRYFETDVRALLAGRGGNS